MHDTTAWLQRAVPRASRRWPLVRYKAVGALLAVLCAAVTGVSCGGGGGGGGAPGAAVTPIPTATPGPLPTVALDLLRRAPGFVLFGGGPEGLRPALSRDGRVVAFPQQDAEAFTYEDPFLPGLIRQGYLYCARAFVWRDAGSPAALDPDPGCPFAETPGQPYGDSWPAALTADGSVALVNRQIVAHSPYATFGFAGSDGSWDEVLWQVSHPLAARVPNYQGNDMTPDGTTVVGMAWLEYPWPGWVNADARPWRYVRGSDAPEWLPAAGDAIESAQHVSDDGAVIVGCCDDDERGTRSLPVVWSGDAPPEVLPALPGAGDYCRVSDLSGDGRVAVGFCGARAVRWVDGMPSEIVVGGTPPQSEGSSSAALAVSVDGGVILGRSNAIGLEEGWLWSEPDGVRSVRSVLEDAGIDAGDGTIGSRTLYPPAALARDGKVLVGYGTSGVGDGFLDFLYRATLR